MVSPGALEDAGLPRAGDVEGAPLCRAEVLEVLIVGDRYQAAWREAEAAAGARQLDALGFVDFDGRDVH